MTGERFELRRGAWVTLAPAPCFARRLLVAPLRAFERAALMLAVRFGAEHVLAVEPLCSLLWCTAERVAPSKASRVFDAMLGAPTPTTSDP